MLLRLILTVTKYPIKNLLFDLLQILTKEEAVVLIIVERRSESKVSYGKIHLSLKDEMTLRLRSSLSLAFPKTVAIEAHKASSSESFDEDLSNEIIIDCLNKMNYLLLCQQTKAKRITSIKVQEIIVTCMWTLLL